MAIDADEVRVAVTGHVWVGDVGATEPTDISTPFGATWTDLGFTTEDGVVFTMGKTTDDIMGWQSSDPLRTLVTATTRTLAYELMQMDAETFLLAMGGGTLTGSLQKYAYEPPAAEVVDERAMGVEFADGTLQYRWIFRRCLISEDVETKLAKASAVSFPITQKVLAAPGAAKPFLFQTNDDAFTPPV